MKNDNNNNNTHGAPSCKSPEHLQRHMDTLTSSQTHTQTHACTDPDTHVTHTLQMSNTCINSPKATDQYAEEKRWVCSFDLKEENEDECLTERGRNFQITGPMH